MSDTENTIESTTVETAAESAASVEETEETALVEAEEGAQDIEEAPQDIEALTDEEDVDSEDSLTFSNGVIEKIVAIAMREVPGVVGMKGNWFNRVQDAFGPCSSSTARMPRRSSRTSSVPWSSRSRV